MGSHFTVAVIAIGLVAVCVLIHYETLNQLERTARLLRRHRWIILITVHAMLAAHVVEIWIFGFGYRLVEHDLGIGRITGIDEGWVDYIYFSAMVYTTVGFGDILPKGALRMMASTEALAGLSLITWSASFTFLQMQRIWRS